ncbi:hypothetical protein LJR219_003893 [Phenylobacterium sp. LjRoot219]|uniref:hypothetical protein n=1 Tax=Phenylobacterium sp. LjRoot219 TaxID=3342283 RepID=UPI003ECC2362
MIIPDRTGRALPRFTGEAAPPVRPPPGRTLGAVTGVQVSADGHIWVLHLASIMEWGPPGSLDDPAARLPAVVEFDAAGNFLQAWGGPDHLPRVDGQPQWPKQEETIAFDAEDTLWVFGANTAYDHAVQRFTRDGRLLLRIGRFGETGGDQSGELLGCPTDAWHDVARREVYITDGYVNHRVAVFNSDTGAFLRAFGADGQSPPFAASGPATFANPVHAISRGPDGLLYVCDRINCRVLAFDAVGRAEPRLVRDIALKLERPFGSTFNVAFTADGGFMLINDGSDSRLWTFDLTAGEIVDAFRAPNSEGADLSATVHKITTDRDGNLILGRTGRAVERMRFEGLRTA